MNDSVKKKFLYFGLLAAVLCCPLISKAFLFSRVSDVAALLWLYASLELVSRFRAKKERILSGAVFTVGYSVFYFGAIGDAWLSILPVAAFGVIIFLGFCFSARIMLKWNRFPVTLVFPAVWLLGSMLSTLLRFPSLVRLDMMFTNMTVLLQSERLIGSTWLSFALLWIVSLMRYAVANRKGWCAGLGTGLFLLLLVPGLVFLSSDTAPSDTIRVAYTTGPYVGDFMNFTSVSIDVHEKSMENAVRDAAREKADMLVWNEEAFEIYDTDEDRFLSRCAEMAKENDLVLLVGLDVKDTDNSEGGLAENKLVLIGSDGEILDAYRKYCLIPILESKDYVAGDRVIPSHSLEIHGKNVKISFLICYDSNFPRYVNQLDDDTDILFLPSWDWAAITKFHAKLCRTIAAENRISLLKPTYDGISVAYDPYGALIHTGSTDETGFEHVQVVEMPLTTSYGVTSPAEASSPFIPAIIAAELLSALFCLLLLIVDKLKSAEKSRRARWFTVLVTCTLVGTLSDALSWLLDGCPRLLSVLYISTAISTLMTAILFGVFIVYLTEYIKERGPLRWNPVPISWIYTGVVTALTVAAILSGQLFTFENGVYEDRPLYAAYVIANAGAMLLALAVVFLYQRSLDPVDRAIVYAYMLLPILSATVNLFFEEWSFAYPAITLSLLLLYLMLQTEKMEQLAYEGRIVSYHATHDDLTGLNNRRAFTDHTDRLKGMSGSCGVIFGDLNGLKYANDNFGHEAGDQLLLRYTEILSGIFRKSEIYRISGDEFICLMENVPEKILTERVAELRSLLAQDEQPLACIGTAYGSNHKIDDLLKEAEAGMYAEKEIVHEKFPKTRR